MTSRRVDQTEIAHLLGKSQSVISDRLVGKTEFRIGELQKIAAFLKVPLEQLLTPIQASLDLNSEASA